MIVDGKQRTCLLARLKLEAKLGRKLLPYEVVDHKDDDPCNDRYSNLQLFSYQENNNKANCSKHLTNFSKSREGKRHTKELGLLNTGDGNGNAKLENFDVEAYRKLFAKGKLSIREIVADSGVSPRSVVNFLEGKTYPNAGGPISVVPKKPRGRPKKWA